MIYAWFMPESPRWLATQDRLDDATRSLRRIRGPRYAEEHIQVEINAIKDAIAAEKAAQEGASVLDIFRGTDLRRTVLASCCATMHASSGINFREFCHLDSPDLAQEKGPHCRSCCFSHASASHVTSRAPRADLTRYAVVGYSTIFFQSK